MNISKTVKICFLYLDDYKSEILYFYPKRVTLRGGGPGKFLLSVQQVFCLLGTTRNLEMM